MNLDRSGRRILHAAMLMLCAGLRLVSCGGAGGATATFAPTPAPSPTVSLPSTFVVTTALQPSAAGMTETVSPGTYIAAVTGIASSTYAVPFTLPSGLTLMTSTAAPQGVPAFVPAGLSSTSHLRGKLDATPRVLLYESLTPTTTLTGGGPYHLGLDFVSAVPTGVTFHLAFFNGSSWQADASGSPGSVSTTVSSEIDFNGTIPPATVLTTHATYALAFYTVPIAATPAATPSPSPSASADAGAVVIPTPQPFPTGPGSPTPIATSVALASGGTPTTLGNFTGFAGTQISVTLPLAPGNPRIAYTTSTVLPYSALPAVPASYGNYIYFGVIPSSDVVLAQGSSAAVRIATSPKAPPLADGTVSIAVFDTSNPGQGWISGLGSSATSNFVTTITYTLPFDLTLRAGAAYYVVPYVNHL